MLRGDRIENSPFKARARRGGVGAGGAGAGGARALERAEAAGVCRAGIHWCARLPPRAGRVPRGQALPGAVQEEAEQEGGRQVHIAHLGRVPREHVRAGGAQQARAWLGRGRVVPAKLVGEQRWWRCVRGGGGGAGGAAPPPPLHVRLLTHSLPPSPARSQDPGQPAGGHGAREGGQGRADQGVRARLPRGLHGACTTVVLGGRSLAPAACPGPRLSHPPTGVPRPPPPPPLPPRTATRRLWPTTCDSPSSTTATR